MRGEVKKQVLRPRPDGGGAQAHVLKMATGEHALAIDLGNAVGLCINGQAQHEGHSEKREGDNRFPRLNEHWFSFSREWGPQNL